MRECAMHGLKRKGRVYMIESSGVMELAYGAGVWMGRHPMSNVF